MANPSGTFMPLGMSSRNISPNDAVLPPTIDMSVIPISWNHLVYELVFCELGLLSKVAVFIRLTDQAAASSGSNSPNLRIVLTSCAAETGFARHAAAPFVYATAAT